MPGGRGYHQTHRQTHRHTDRQTTMKTLPSPHTRSVTRTGSLEPWVSLALHLKFIIYIIYLYTLNGFEEFSDFVRELICLPTMATSFVIHCWEFIFISNLHGAKHHRSNLAPDFKK